MTHYKKLLSRSAIVFALLGYVSGMDSLEAAVDKKVGGSNKNKNYRVVKVVKDELRDVLTLQGLFEPFTKTNLSPARNSTVLKILVKELQVVKRGDVLAIVRSLDHSILMGTAEVQVALAKQKRAKTTPDSPERAKADLVVEKARDDLEFAESQFADGIVLASRKGFIVDIFTREGENFSPGQRPLITIGDRLIIRVKANQMDAARLEAGMKAQIKSEAYPGKKFSATVYSVSATGSKRDWESAELVTFEVVIDLPKNPEKWIKVGMTADVDVEVFHKANVLKVPREFVVTEGKGLNEGEGYIFTGDPKKSEKIKIKVGESDRTHIEIVEGLEEGDEVYKSSEPSSASDRWWNEGNY